MVILRDVPLTETISAEEIHEGRDVDVHELRNTPREYQEMVVGLAAGHAGGEAFVLQHDVFARWANEAPTTEDRFMVLKTIEEELMHAQVGWRLLRQIGSELVDWSDLVPYEHNGSRYEGFRHSTEDWSEMAAIAALTDRVGCFQQEEQLDCSYIPYAKAIQTAYFPVEKGHAARGRFWLKELCTTDDGRERAQAAVDLWWPRALDMFGRSESQRQHRFIDYRLKKRTNEERRQAYIEALVPELAELGLTVPDHFANRQFV